MRWRTLPARQFRAGYAEMAKYGLLGDAAFFAWLEQNWSAVFAQDTTALTHALDVSVQGKADIVARDETETGDRMLLNLGHTFGHAVEAWAGYLRSATARRSDGHRHGPGVPLLGGAGLCLGGGGAAGAGAPGAVGLPTRIGDIPGGKSRRRR